MSCASEDLDEAGGSGDAVVVSADDAEPRVVATYTFPYQADVAQWRLALEGIPSTVADAAMAGWFWQYSNAVGGAKLVVAPRDAARAVEILNEARLAASADAATDDAAAPLEPTPPAPAGHAPRRWECQHCGVRVPEVIDACWSCGTTREGQLDPEFQSEGAPIGDYDPDRRWPFWWRIFCFLCPPTLLYEVLLAALPDGPARAPLRRRTIMPLPRDLVHACLLAVIGIGFMPLALMSAGLLAFEVRPPKGVAGRRQRRFVAAAVAIDSLLLLTLGLLVAEWIDILRFLYD